MSRKYSLYSTLLFLLLFLIQKNNLYAQITGITSTSSCGVVGYTYTYSIAGTMDNNTMFWCVSGGGGIIVQAFGNSLSFSGNCVSGMGIGQIVVKWTVAGTGLISITSSNGSPSKSVPIVNPLNPGSITSNKTQTISYNTAPANINCSAASGGDCAPSFSYQWQQSINSVDWTDVANKTSQNFSTTALLIQTTYYRRKVTETQSNTVDYSDVATVNVSPPFSYTVLSPAFQDIFSGQTPTTITGAAATGGNCSGNYTYQWQYSTNGGSTYSNITTNGTGLNYSPGALMATTYYRRKVMCGTDVAYSSVSIVNVYQHLTAGSLSPSSQKISYNTSPSITATVPMGGMCSSYNYQWYSSNDNSTFTLVSGATGQNYNTGNLTTGTTSKKIYYRRTVSCGSESVNSNTITVTVNPQLFPGTVVPGNLTITPNTSPGTLTASAASGGGCSGSYSYQWQSSADGNDWNYTDIAGATSLNYTPGNLSATIYFRREVSCDIDTKYSNACKVTVNSASSGTHNYITERILSKPGITDETIAGQLTSITDVKQTKQYFDGLGRLLQVVSMQASPIQKDIAVPHIYDDFGREVIKYLPYVATTNDGKYKANAIVDQGAFNASQFPDEEFYYSRIDYDVSPLNTVRASYAQGDSWVGNNTGIKTNYWTNTIADKVKIWTVTDVANSFGTYATTAEYAEEDLFKNVSVDENGKQVIEFKDLQGKIILKKVQLTATADNGLGKDYTGWLCTYYIYDNYDNMRCVIQPEGVKLLSANNWSMNALSGNILNEQCFRYEYDYRNRMIMKKIPGEDEVYMVYDNRDRLVFTQDGKMRGNDQWSYILYDDFNRAIQTGVMVYTSTIDNLRTYVKGRSNTTAGSSVTGTNVAKNASTLTLSQRENGLTNYTATNSINFVEGFESESGADFTAEIVTETTTTFSNTIDVNTNPVPSSGTLYPLIYTY